MRSCLVAWLAVAPAVVLVATWPRSAEAGGLKTLVPIIECQKPTDEFLNGPSDEPYLLVVGKIHRANGQVQDYKRRLPDHIAEQHFNLKAGEKTFSHLNLGDHDDVLVLNPGDSAEFDVLLMEEDDNTVSQIMSLGSSILTNLEDPDAVAVGGVLGFLAKLVTNTDDFIGAFSLHADCPVGGDGTLRVSIKGLRNVVGVSDFESDRGDYPSNYAGKEFIMNGDGSRYRIRISAGH